MNKKEEFRKRDFCYTCYRPESSCMCKYINTIETKTKFIILMHPKEFRKTKNGTGQFTKNSLSNSELYIGINFTNHKKINKIIENPENESYLLYPDENSHDLSSKKIDTDKNLVIFIIDSTWPCSKKIIKESTNLQKLKMLSFTTKIKSAFKIKRQPSEYCLSTIESTQYILELLNNYNYENLKIEELNNMSKPFEKMVDYQIKCAEKKSEPRFKIY